MDVQIDTKKSHGVQQARQKMSKEERAQKRRNDHTAREKDRERKRAKRMNVAYRQIEQERDRERKKMLRSDTAFRTLEKIRDRLRKERKKFGLEKDRRGNLSTTVRESLLRHPKNSGQNNEISSNTETLLEPEVVLSSGEAPVDKNLLEPEVILSTNEYNQPQNSYNQIPQQYNNNFTYENPHQNHF